jgi:hypothetical protein
MGLRLTGASRHNSPEMAPTFDTILPLSTGRRRRPRRRPDKLHADKACEAKTRRQECRAGGNVPRIARKGVERSQKLGRHRWVVERTDSWFNRFCRLPIRDERRADIYEIFTSLAASLISLNQITRFC